MYNYGTLTELCPTVAHCKHMYSTCTYYRETEYLYYKSWATSNKIGTKADNTNLAICYSPAETGRVILYKCSTHQLMWQVHVHVAYEWDVLVYTLAFVIRLDTHHVQTSPVPYYITNLIGQLPKYNKPSYYPYSEAMHMQWDQATQVHVSMLIRLSMHHKSMVVASNNKYYSLKSTLKLVTYM